MALWNVGSSQTSIKPESPVSPGLAGGFFTTEPPGKPINRIFKEIHLTGEIQRVLKGNVLLDNMNLKFLKICIKKKNQMPFGAQWESFTIKTPFTSQKSDWKQMVKCAANKRAILSIVEAEQSVSYRPTALTVTAADGGRRELTSRTLKLKPGVHLQSTSGQSDKSLWSNTIILNKKREFWVGVYVF